MKRISYAAVALSLTFLSGCTTSSNWSGHTFKQANIATSFSDDDNYDSLVKREIDFRHARIKQISASSYEFELTFDPPLKANSPKDSYILVHTDFDIDRDIETGYHFYGMGVDCHVSFYKKDGETEWQFGRTVSRQSKELFDIDAKEIKDDTAEFKYVISFKKGFLGEKGFNFRVRAAVKGADRMDVSPAYTVKTSNSGRNRRSEQRR